MDVYYYIRNVPELDTPRRNFDAVLLWHLEKNNSGEVFLHGIQAKIIYDRNNGQVELVDVEPNPNLTTDYSPIQTQFTAPVKQAISILAKLELLRELSQLGDPAIAKIYAETQNKIQHAHNATEIGAMVERGLKLVFNSVAPKAGGLGLFTKPIEKTPLQNAIYAALLQVGNNIDSSAAVRNTMERISELTSTAPQSRL